MKLIKNTSVLLLLTALSYPQSGCKKFVEVESPVSELTRRTVFDNNETAGRSVLGIYSTLSNDANFAAGNFRSLSFLSGLSSDELLPANPSYALAFDQFHKNTIFPENEFVEGFWSQLYEIIYRANSIIEGLETSTQVSAELKNQLVGEARFIRGFCHFYLVNFWGEIPVALTTNYLVNSTLEKTPVDRVYEQIITDLKDAQLSLQDKYVSTNGYAYANGIVPMRVRPNKAVATALLARVYLFTGDWANAEIEASRVISNPNYGLEPLDNVFLKNSSEAIWQLSRDDQNSPEGRLFTEPGKNGILTSSLQAAFTDEDQRKIHWVDTFSDGTKHPAKYRAQQDNPITEYSIVFRLAEQYLIRAEAKANLNDLFGAEADLNKIRIRARLETINSSGSKELLLPEIYLERRRELFSEWGHRWLDLKRTGKMDELMSTEKSATWQSFAALYPIPKLQIDKSHLKQNPGYF